MNDLKASIRAEMSTIGDEHALSTYKDMPNMWNLGLHCAIFLFIG